MGLNHDSYLGFCLAAFMLIVWYREAANTYTKKAANFKKVDGSLFNSLIYKNSSKLQWYTFN